LVRVPVPKHVRYKTAQPVPSSPPAGGELTWDLGTLKGGQKIDITFVVDVEPGTVEDILCDARVVFEHGERVQTRVQKPDLRVRTIGPENTRLYEIIPYAIEVTNTGAVAANDVVLTEELPPGLGFSDSNPSTPGTNPLTWKLGTLLPNQPRRIEFKVIAQQEGTHLLKAAVTAAGLKPLEEKPIKVSVGEPKLSLVITGPAWRSSDLPADYLLTVSNNGTSAATNVEVRDDLFSRPVLRDYLEFVGASDNGRLVNNDIRWQIGTLVAGARRTLRLTLRTVPSKKYGGTFENLATVQADQGLKASSMCKTEFAKPDGLTLDVEKILDPVPIAKPTVLTFRVRQIGTTTSKNVALNITLPSELQYVDAHGPSAGMQEGKTVSFAAIGEFAAGGEAVYTVTVRPEKAAEVQIRATLTAEPAPKGGKLERVDSMIILPELATTSPAPVLEKSGK
jgi:uncharacterized repeat protein (TIGR01451 family)